MWQLVSNSQCANTCLFSSFQAARSEFCLLCCPIVRTALPIPNVLDTRRRGSKSLSTYEEGRKRRNEGEERCFLLKQMEGKGERKQYKKEKKRQIYEKIYFFISAAPGKNWHFWFLVSCFVVPAKMIKVPQKWLKNRQIWIREWATKGIEN